MLDRQRLVRLLQHLLDQIQRDELRLVVLGNDNVFQKILLDDETIDDETTDDETTDDETTDDETTDEEIIEVVVIDDEMMVAIIINVQMV